MKVRIGADDPWRWCELLLRSFAANLWKSTIRPGANFLFCFAHLSKLFPAYTQMVVGSFFPRLRPFTPGSDEQMQVSKQEDWSLYEPR